MANVTFRRGTEANLPSSGMADEGCFFLAEDTGNLYVGDENGNLVPINRSPYYGTCPTEASTNSKVVTIDVNSDVFSLSVGTMISVRFANANTAASPTLNVNGSGAIAVKSYGTTSIGDTEDSSWHAGEVVTFIYDGTYWMFVGGMGNIQPDWEQDTDTADDYIKNKPSIRTGVGEKSIVEGSTVTNESIGKWSHSEGARTIAYSNASHAEGLGIQNSILLTSSTDEGSTDKDYKVFIGSMPIVGNVIGYNGNYVTVTAAHENRMITLSETLGTLNRGSVNVLTSSAKGFGSHIEGESTMTNNEAEHAEGMFNSSNTGDTNAEKTISSIGIGTSNNSRKNAVEVMKNGDVYIDRIGGYNEGEGPSTLQDVIDGIQSDIQTISETQSDWEEDDTESSSYIQNKPSIKAGIGVDSVEEGSLLSNYALGRYSHAEGLYRFAHGDYSHAEGAGETLTITISGSDTTYHSSDIESLKVGDLIVYGDLSAQVTGFGKSNFSVDSSLGTLLNASADVYVDGAIGADSHVEGWGTIAFNKAEHAEGKFNVSHNTKNELTISSIGIGTGNNDRINAIEVLSNGAVFIKGIGLYAGSSLSNASSIQEVISHINSNIHSYTIESVSPDTGYLTAYQLKEDNTFVGAKINIPKDMVVSNGEVKTVTVADEPYVGAQVGDKYIDLTIANATTDHLYIPVKDLVDMYYEGNGIDISSGNVVSVVVDPNNANGLSVGASGVALATATTSSAGAMSATDKTKLEGIAIGAEVNQNAFSNVVVGNTTIAADSKTDILTLEAGNNITLTPDATNDKVTIAASVPSPADTNPLMDGIADKGASIDYAREDHVHPSDTSKQDSLTAGTDLEIIPISGLLPSGYVQLDYIQSTGAQCINTGYSLTDTDTLEIDYVLNPSSSGTEKYIARQEPYTWLENYSSNNQWYVRFGSSSSSNTAYSSSHSTGTIVLKKNYFGINGTRILQPSYNSMGTGGTLTLFAALSNNNVVGGSYITISEARIKNSSNVVIHRYVPAKRNSDDAIGMYDVAGEGITSQGFRSNLGSTAFIAGPQTQTGGALINFTNETGYITAASLPTVGTLDTTGNTSLTPNASESLSGNVALHKVSKTGDYDDLNETPIFNEGSNIAIRDLIPYNDYTPLDYAISDSGTYIDTGIKPLNDDVELDIRFKITSFYYSYFALFGDIRSTAGAQNFGLCFFGNKKLGLYNGQSSAITVTNDIATGHIYHVVATLKSGSASLYVVDETAGTSETKTGTYTSATYAYNLNMLWRRYNGDNKMPNVYVYKAVARFRGASAMNYIPAKRKSDSAGGFIDTVSGNFITGTTGSFTAGNEIDNKEYVISANQQLKFNDILSKPFTSKYTYWAPGAAVTAGWRKLATGLYCSNYLLIIRGTYSSGRPTVAGIAVSCYANNMHLKQLWGTIYSVGGPSSFRLVETSTYTFDLEYYHGAVSSNPGTRYFSFIGLGALTIPDDAHTLVENQEVPSGITTTQLDIRVMLDRPTIRTNLASTSSSYYDGRSITPGVTGTLPIGNGGTGGSTAKAAEYNLTTNLATNVDTDFGDSSRIPVLAGTQNTTNGRFGGYRTGLKMWNYINGKLGSVLGITASTAYDGKEIVDELGTTYTLNNHYIDYSGTWISSTTHGHYAIPIEGVKAVRIKAPSPSTSASFFTFVKNYAFAEPPTSDYAEGYWSRNMIPGDAEIEVLVPSDAEYLIVYTGSKSTQPYKPESLKLYGDFSTMIHDGSSYYGHMGTLTAEEAVVSDWRNHDVTSLVLSSLIRNGYIQSSTNKYISGTYYSSFIPLSTNVSKIKLTAGDANTRIAFLHIDVSSNTVVSYAGETSSILVNANETVSLDVPSGTLLLYIFLGTLSNGKYSATPKSLCFTGNRGVENFQLKFGNMSYDGSFEATIPSFTGATTNSNGVEGLVTAPMIADKDKFLKGDGTWAIPEGTLYSDFVGSDDAHVGSRGLVPAPSMSSAPKILTSDRTTAWQTKDSLDIASKTYVDNMIGDIETLLAAI